MKNIEIAKTAKFEFDDSIKVSIDHHGEPRHYEVTGGKLNVHDVDEDRVYLCGYELTKTGRRRKNSTSSYIYIPNEVAVMIEGEYQFITTPAPALLEKVKALGLSLIYPKEV